MIGIYKITNKKTGKVYIGQSDNVERRLSEHKQKRTQTIDNYINVLGVENFDFEILEECNLEDLELKEREYIKEYNSQIEGYNIQEGGFNNSQGEGNGRALLKEADIVFIRTAYKNHESQKEIFEKYFSGKITKNNFQSIWQGRTWVNIMPEVYTEENKKYYTSEQNRIKASLSKEEVLEYRKFYINHTREEVFQKMIKDKGDILKRNTFFKILIGDVRDTSIYKEIPVYKKSKSCWELNGEAVSTIPESGE
jgi:group I intron endonuclease